MQLEYIDIIDSIQYAVNKIAKINYKHDIDSPPKYTVSLLETINAEGNVNGQQIILTIQHMGQTRSRPLFPRLDCKYGLESLSDEMKWLYNSTM